MLISRLLDFFSIILKTLFVTIINNLTGFYGNFAHVTFEVMKNKDNLILAFFLIVIIGSFAGSMLAIETNNTNLLLGSMCLVFAAFLPLLINNK